MQSQPRPSFREDGTVHVPAFELPPSELSSPEARAMQAYRAKMPGGAPLPGADIKAIRASLEAMLGPQVARMREVYPADIVEQTIGGIAVRVVTPRGKPFDQKRVLINLHGGAFSVCADACSLLESIPVAVLGSYKVVTVDYRMAPEAVHPAAVEDLERVYRELLKDIESRHIGIYGCSAGGALTAQAAAWLPAHGLPQPGAIGIFGAGAIRFAVGDSAHVTAYIDGSFPAPPKPGDPPIDLTHGYFTGADENDAIISPALHLDVLARFPPTLIITAKRWDTATSTSRCCRKRATRSRRSSTFSASTCASARCGLPSLRAIIGWGCASLLGAFGWWLGEHLNLIVAVIVSAIASGIGLYYGRKWFDDNLA